MPYVTRAEATATCLAALEESGTSWQALAAKVGRNPVWVAAAIHGQATMDATEAAAVADLLSLDEATTSALQRIPTKGSDVAVSSDPFLYRFQEINQTFGAALKAVAQEMFGDGIMSAIDFEVDVARVADPAGDRVQITYSGKFLPYRKF